MTVSPLSSSCDILDFDHPPALAPAVLVRGVRTQQDVPHGPELEALLRLPAELGTSIGQQNLKRPGHQDPCLPDLVEDLLRVLGLATHRDLVVRVRAVVVEVERGNLMPLVSEMEEVDADDDVELEGPGEGRLSRWPGQLWHCSQ